ncbi:hypothetical protein ACFLIM_33500 [Nonomuraea sp. M3C6]|uniref:Uncharacterized protein n=1 Tax=Nonomuraea marmarensis TaxID=3351344 RepID=A0ABW7AL71_9ACTN
MARAGVVQVTRQMLSVRPALLIVTAGKTGSGKAANMADQRLPAGDEDRF